MNEQTLRAANVFNYSGWAFLIYGCFEQVIAASYMAVSISN